MVITDSFVQLINNLHYRPTRQSDPFRVEFLAMGVVSVTRSDILGEINTSLGSVIIAICAAYVAAVDPLGKTSALRRLDEAFTPPR